MAKSKRTSGDSLRSRFAAFVIEHHPFAGDVALEAFDHTARALGFKEGSSPSTIPLREGVTKRIRAKFPSTASLRIGETTPGVSAKERLDRATGEFVGSVEGFFSREDIRLSLTSEEKRELLRGMVLTRAVDNRLKQFFTGGEIRFGATAFQGKGFRSLGQEAIYGAPLRLRRGERWRRTDGSWSGDVVAPLIRDLGAALCMRPTADTVRMALNAQMGKAGPPMEGKDLHLGDFSWGILPASAPLSISTMTVAGLAMGFSLEGSERVAISFIGEGGTSLGEWHEAINLCAARRLPAVFCVQNNQIALSTPVKDQSAVRTFADKATGYGITGLTLDGTDPEAICSAFAWAAERARAGSGPTLIELVCMRMCGHAHHDDMLYLGRDPQPSRSYTSPSNQGYADPDRFAFWAAKDPIEGYFHRLVREGVVGPADLERMREEATGIVETEARAVVETPWPDPISAGLGVFSEEPARLHRDPLADPVPSARTPSELPPVDRGPEVDPKGATFLEAVMAGVGDALRADSRVFVYGEDVGGKYGNAFLLLRPLLEEFADRILNSPISEGGVLGVCVGSALAGRRPIGEIQFNDFVATGFNQLVNNAAKTRYRWGGSVPMVVRMPWGGLRRAGPYHSQNTEPWFYRTPGIKIVVPSTPFDARALMASAIADPDPVLYYEHIALYRDPKIKQRLGETPPDPLPLGKAALRRAGSDLALVSYGAYVHVCMRVANALAEEGTECAVLDLRSLAPLDREAVLSVARHCGKVLLAHEDSRTGGIGESLAAVIQEECFEDLDAPVRIVGALDAPVPYSPPLEDAFLPGYEGILAAARTLAAF